MEFNQLLMILMGLFGTISLGHLIVGQIFFRIKKRKLKQWQEKNLKERNLTLT